MVNNIAHRAQAIQPFYVMDLLNRAKQLEAMGRDIIHMEIGEPDFPTPRAVIAAGIKQLQTGAVKYTAAKGLVALRQEISFYYQRSHGVKVDPERIFVTPGASGALLLALGSSLNPGESILMADPCYPCNANFIHFLGGVVKTIPVDAGSGYQLTEQMIKSEWEADTKGVMVASPSNPTGTLIDRKTLENIIRAAESLGGCFFSDEIYHGLVYGEEAASALEFSDEVFVINSFSKYFGMTGWRIGWLVVPERFIEAAEKLAQTLFISSNAVSQYAALAAFTGDNLLELERRKNEFAERRDFLYENLLRLNLNIPVKPEGAFYIYADCSKFCDDSFTFAQDLLEDQAVAVTPGKDFGRNQAERYLRFAYTTSIDKITVAMGRLEKFIHQTT